MISKLPADRIQFVSVPQHAAVAIAKCLFSRMLTTLFVYIACKCGIFKQLAVLCLARFMVNAKLSALIATTFGSYFENAVVITFTDSIIGYILYSHPQFTVVRTYVVSCRFGGRIGNGPGEFNKPAGLCFDRSSNLLIADECNSRVVMHRAYDGARVTCAFERVITTDVYSPKGVSVNIHENLVVCDGSANSHLKIFKYK
jgi:hypothetical protein